VNYDSFSVGLHLQSQGVKALHPVIMVPGVISTGLESWGTEAESRQYFRKRLWGVSYICSFAFSLSWPPCPSSIQPSGNVSRLKIMPCVEIADSEIFQSWSMMRALVVDKKSWSKLPFEDFSISI